MKHNWKKVPLKDLTSKSTFIEAPVSDKEYKQAGIQLWGKGFYEREKILGQDTAYKYFYQLKTGDLVLNKIWARNGAVSVVPKAFNGFYVSTEFPVFHVNDNLVEPEWLELVTKQKWFWQACHQQAFGTSGKNRIKPEKFLEIEIPVPEISLQKLIVKKVRSVQILIANLGSTRRQQKKDISNLAFSCYINLTQGADWLTMSEVAPIIRREVNIDENGTYPETGIRSFGKGTFHKPTLTGLDVGTKTLYQIKAGDLMFSNVFAWEGAIAVAKQEDDNRYGSHRFISCEVNREIAIPQFLCYHFLTERGMQDINLASPGGAGRNKTLGLTKLMKIEVPVPEMEAQREFVALLNQLETIKTEHHQSDKELSELIPSLLDKAFKGEL